MNGSLGKWPEEAFSDLIVHAITENATCVSCKIDNRRYAWHQKEPKIPILRQHNEVRQ